MRRGRKRPFSQHRWKGAALHHLVSLPVILSRIKHGRENWIHRLWQRLPVQWSTSSTNSMARRMKKVMTQSDSSILYSLTILITPQYTMASYENDLELLA